jgi:purine-binding chemotaxis protein CheW
MNESTISPSQNALVQKHKYLLFHLNNEEYAINIASVTEIIGYQKFTTVPDMPEYIIGIFNLRGKVIPIMDIRLRFRLPFKEYDDRTCIIVISVGEVELGLLVDTVSEVMNILPEQMQIPPDVSSKKNSHFIESIGKVDDRVILVLNTHAILFDNMSCNNVLEAKE